MEKNIVLSLAGLITVGMVLQWLAWRFKQSAILFLLIGGFLLGPVTGIFNPDKVFGSLLFPFVSLAVSIILFEGGMSLQVKELRIVGRTVIKLTTLGALITWVLSTFFAIQIFQINQSEAMLLAAILVVTGPTVIAPILRLVRPKSSVSSILKWEGIVIDPLGAMLAIIIFEIMQLQAIDNTSWIVFSTVFKVLCIGSIFGLLSVGMVIVFLKNFWLPDIYHNPFTLANVLLTYALANTFQAESGLVAVTVMGFALANQTHVHVAHIFRFKEELRVLLLSCLFIVLTARLNMEAIFSIGLKGLLFVSLLIFLVRPIAIYVSTFRENLKWQEKVFLAFMAPRGIVAAAISAILVYELQHGYYRSHTIDYLIPITYIVIASCAIFYSLIAIPLARYLGVKQAKSNGILIASAHSWARSIAFVLQEYQFQVTVVDTNRQNIARARLEGLDTYYGSILSEDILERPELHDIGILLALTSNEEVNILATRHFQENLGRASVYLLPNENQSEAANLSRFKGRYLFGENVNYQYLEDKFNSGWELKATPLTQSFTFTDFQLFYRDQALPMFMINAEKELIVFSAEMADTFKDEGILISLIPSGLPENMSHSPTKSNDFSLI